MKKIDKIKKYLKENPSSTEKMLAKKFKLTHIEVGEFLQQIKESSLDTEKNHTNLATNKKDLPSFLHKIFQTRVIYVILFLIAALIRIAYATKLGDFPQLNIPILDAEYYFDWAKKIADGDLVGKGAFFTEPFYAYFLAIFIKVFSNPTLAITTLQMILGSLLPIVVMKIMEKISLRSIGIIAGFITAIYGPFIFYENLLLKTSLEIFFLAVFVWFFMYMIESKNIKFYAIGGILLGLISIIKGNNLILLPIAIFLIFHSNNLIRKEKWIFSSIFAFGLILAISPLTIRNYLVAKDFVPTNYSLGIVTYQGNWWGGDGSTALVPSFYRPHPKYEETDQIKMAEAYEQKQLKASEISRFWITKSIQESFSNPIHFIKTLFGKIFILFNYHELSDDYSYDFYGKFIAILKILPGFIFISSLSICGIILSLFSKELKWQISKYSNKNALQVSKRLNILLYITGGYILVLLASNINSRYRMPLIPLLIIFSSLTIWYVYIKIKERSSGYIFGTFSLILLGFLISIAPLKIYSSINEEANAYNQIASIYNEKGEYEKAKPYYEETLNKDKNYAWAYKNLFLINLYQGNITTAEKNITDLILIRPDDLSNYDSLALLKEAQEKSVDEVKDKTLNLLQGNQEIIYDQYSYEASRFIAKNDNNESQPLLLKSLETYNNPANSLIALAGIKRTEGKTDEAISYLSLAIENNPYLLPARYNLANIYIEQKNYMLVIPQLKFIYDITPELGQTWSNLAIAYINTKNPQAQSLVEAYVKKYENDSTKKEMVNKFKDLLSKSSSANPTIK
jgi:tetratricopeptide (TPR) repeat protein